LIGAKKRNAESQVNNKEQGHQIGEKREIMDFKVSFVEIIATTHKCSGEDYQIPNNGS
jgi:hypothetical protein